MNKDRIVYEDAAEQRIVTGWCCKTCGRLHLDEHMARWCHADDLPCKCGGRILRKSYTRCQACIDRANEADWQKALAKAVEWDGEWPLCTWDSDRYFFSDCDVDSYLDNHEMKLADLRVTKCARGKIKEIELGEILSDHLCEGDSTDFTEIDKTVNDWIAANVQTGWYGAGPVVTPESIRQLLNWGPDA